MFIVLKSSAHFLYNNFIFLDDEIVSPVHTEYEDAATSPALDFLPLDIRLSTNNINNSGTTLHVCRVCRAAIVQTTPLATMVLHYVWVDSRRYNVDPWGNLFKWIMHISFNVRSIFSMSSQELGEIFILTVLTPAAFNCTIFFPNPGTSQMNSSVTFKRQSDRDVIGRESRNTEINFEVCFTNCTEEFRWVPSLEVKLINETIFIMLNNDYDD